MEQTLLDLVTRFGYVIVLVGVGIESMGVPVPGETTLVIAAVLAGQGRLQPWEVATFAWVGAVVGDNTGYWIGRRWGRRMTRAPGLRRVYDERRLARAEELVARYGWPGVFLGRFVAILRIFAGPLAGMHGMRWPHFLGANAGGGAVWVAAVMTAGLLLGHNLDRTVRLVGDAGWAGLGLAVVLVAVAVGWRLRRGRVRRRERDRGAGVRGEQEPTRP